MFGGGGRRRGVMGREVEDRMGKVDGRGNRRIGVYGKGRLG